MAGIGFELKKMFGRKGVLAALHAYSYAGVLCAGPLLSGILLQSGILLLCRRAGMPRAEREVLVCMLTYTLLASLLLTSAVSMPLTRFWADRLYEGRTQAVLPALWGAGALLLPVGCGLYGAFLLASGAGFVPGMFCLWLFAEMIVNWLAIGCLNAIRAYNAILAAFLAAMAGAWLTGGIAVSLLGAPALEGFLFAVTAGYGLLLLCCVWQLHRRFPQGGESPWAFLHWMDKFRPLVWTGLLTHIGLFGHLILLWYGRIGVQVRGLFHAAPYYDVPALLAFLSTLVTTVNFVVSVEVQIYPFYQTYCGLFSQGGTAGDIAAAEKQLLAVLQRELWYTALKQLFFTAAVISLESTVLAALPLGFNDLMHGYFRTLCVGYGLYAVGNTMLLILLYLTDHAGAAAVSAVFAALSTGLTLLFRQWDTAYYGFGFLLGAAGFCLAALLRLDAFTAELSYQILGRQPLATQERTGCFTRLADWLERAAPGKAETKDKSPRRSRYAKH